MTLDVEQVRGALEFAIAAHGAQKRKYTDEPYFIHVVSVAERVGDALHGDPLFAPDLSTIIAAALLHDVLEDTEVTEAELRARFGDAVTDLVVELTDAYGPGTLKNRAERKAAERDRLARVSLYAQSIKVADLIDNTSSIVAHDPGFAKVYVPEKRALLEVLTRAHPKLLAQAHATLATAETVVSQL